ncbi:MAG TPA: hypothetical protein VEA38_04115 [Terriglobales bacterium]|nr:hypothetical protein [Terriglobales bacterium]
MNNDRMKGMRFAEILERAWNQHGLKRVETALVQAPNEGNGMTAIFRAEVETDRGVFSAYGDATPKDPKNTSAMIAPHFIRFAESRAIARALRWATNAGEAIDVEMGDYDPADVPVRADQTPFGAEPGNGRGQPHSTVSTTTTPRTPPAGPAPPQRAADSLARPPVRAPSAPDPNLATPAQVRAIYMIARNERAMDEATVDAEALGIYGQRPPELTKKQASDLISRLKAGS